MEKVLTALCQKHLPHVSRTFALTIPVLQEPLRSHVGLAYLLCRLVDTAEDHPRFDQARRDAWLAYWEKSLTLSPLDPLPPSPRWIPDPDPHLEALAADGPRLLRARAQLPPRTRKHVNTCLLEMTRGMRTFPGRQPGTTRLACTTVAELDRYCQVVAGTVGTLLTHLFGQRLPSSWGHSDQLERGRRFGLGLQMVNVLKDRGGDRARGVFYCPDLEPKTDSGLPDPVVRRALEHLRAGHRFLQAIPDTDSDLIAFCLIPHTLALHTLHQLLQGRAKIAREEMPGLLSDCNRAVADTTFREARFHHHYAAVSAHLSAPPPATVQPG